MTAAIIPFPSRHVVYTAEETARRACRPANDSDLASSFASNDRRKDVIGFVLRAAAPRNGMGRGPKGIGAPIDSEERVKVIRVEQATAWLEALIEIADHGPTPDLLGAMHALVLAMDGKLRDRAQERLDAIENGQPISDVAKLRRELARMRDRDFGGPVSATGRDKTLADDARVVARTSARPSPSTGLQDFTVGGAAEGEPPSGPRTLLAADPRYVALRREAMDALGALTGDLAPGVQRLGGVYTPRELARDLAQMASELDVEVLHPSKGNVPRMARQAAALAIIVAVKAPALCGKAKTASERLDALASFVERGGER